MMLKETMIVSVIVFGILTISWFYFSWKIEKEAKEKKENEDKKKKIRKEMRKNDFLAYC